MSIGSSGATIPMRTVDGFAFDAGAEVWKLAARSGPVTLNFGGDAPASADLRGHEKALMMRLIETKQPLRVLCHHEAFLTMVWAAAGCRPGEPVKELVAADLRQLVAGTPPDKQHRIVRLRDFIRAWDTSVLPGLHGDLAAMARDMCVKRPTAGRAVGMLCPVEGALSEGEQGRVLDGLHSSYEDGDVGLDNYLLCLLSTTLVIRPIQIAWLKVRDLRMAVSSRGPSWLISVPRAKQGGAVREMSTEIELTPVFGELLWQQRGAAIAAASIRGIGEESAALFPGLINTNGLKF